jgi:prepilin peptidase CpaA
MTVELWIATVVGLAAVAEDLARRTISNWIPVAALAGGLFCQVTEKGWRGIGAATLGALSGFGIFLIFYLLGGMGGGDVKLMAGFGALLGAGRLLEAAFWTAVIGGLLAAIVLGAGWLRARKSDCPAKQALPRVIPYAPAIAAGVWMALIPKG